MVSKPDEETVAIDVFDDCQVASGVTSRVEPSDIRAVAVNCIVASVIERFVTTSTVTVAAVGGCGVGVTGLSTELPVHAAAAIVRVAVAIRHTRFMYASPLRHRHARRGQRIPHSPAVDLCRLRAVERARQMPRLEAERWQRLGWI